MADAPSVLDTFSGMTEAEIEYVVAHMTDEERAALWREMEQSEANPYFRFRHDVLGFVTRGLGESSWSKQSDVYRAVNEHKKVVVAASHSVGKSHLASRAAGAIALSWPADMVRVMTTATNFRQVKGILWPYIARMHSKYGLPGEVYTTTWKIGREEVGVGFSARNTDEAAVSGFHAPGELFLVVDEGGGIHRVLGQAFTNILTGTGHALVIGNFPTESDDTWFNEIWASDEWHRIRISAFDTPNFPRPKGRSLTSLTEVRKWAKRAQEHPRDPAVRNLYERVGPCTTCPSSIEPHTIAKHLTDIAWVESVAAEFGEDSAYYQTRVLALPASNLVSKTLPVPWLEASVEKAQGPTVPGPVKLGVDVAVDGGDEFVIARMNGWRLSIAHASAGPENENSVHVAGVVLEEIHQAEAYHAEHGFTQRVRVKVDEIGVGRGVSDLLKQWGVEGKHGAEVIGVSSSRKAHDTNRFLNQRSEMWWTVRTLIQPDGTPDFEPDLELDTRIGDRLLGQLNAPKWATNSAGQIVVQRKSEIKEDTGHSPDRADAALLAVYEPPVKRVPNVGPMVVGQTNYWAANG